MRTIYRASIAAAAASICIIAAPVSAATIVPVSATASSATAGYEAGFAIDQGGNSANTDWASGGRGAGSFLNLDLGALYTLGSANIVDRVTSGGPNGTFFGGLSDYTTQFSLTFFSDAAFTNQTAVYTFTKPTPTMTTSPSNFAFTASLANSPMVRYVRYTVVATAGVNPGLSNITFATPAVPEPATWAMMMLGFGGMGVALRRRAKTTTRIRFA